ncbi:MAG: hypothetical protein HKL96_04435 [Phycisphaerales bacterium]|nr:hypothetical protein [Phycisphaerales bacterium]
MFTKSDAHLTRIVLRSTAALTVAAGATIHTSAATLVESKYTSKAHAAPRAVLPPSANPPTADHAGESLIEPVNRNSPTDASATPAELAGYSLTDATAVVSLDAAAAGTDASRYFFGLLDHRSKLAKGFFPGTFLAANVAAQREIAMTWYHFETGHTQLDLFYNEFKWGLDQWTVEFQAPYQHEHVAYPNAAPGSPTSRNFDGFTNFAIVMRSPVYQYVSRDGHFDYSLVPGLEIDPPSGSPVSSGTTITPRLMQAIALGDHLSVMTSVGLSFLTGSHQYGQKTLTWDAVLGYNLYHKDMPIPWIADITPVFEIVGSDPLTGPNVGQQSITALGGLEINPKPQWGYLTPYLGVGAGPALTSSARHGGDWVLSAYLAFALP